MGNFYCLKATQNNLVPFTMVLLEVLVHPKHLMVHKTHLVTNYAPDWASPIPWLVVFLNAYVTKP
jgi:hypothetical protein